ncbi:MAG TPA: glycosyltransferase family 2 protein [Candidatus Wallbacteria bacterium]|nr:glycosyltransferase family 2 protein [Candidatus Wallbacteria bacterium]
MSNIKISFVIITFNEEKNIARAMKSVSGIADEIVILDSGSSDRTVEISSGLGARVYQNKFADFASQKNMALSYAAMDYVFVLDADEELSQELVKWLSNFKSGVFKQFDDGGVKGFFIPRKSSFLGKWINHSGWFPDYTLRLMKRGSGAFKKARVHESITVDGLTAKIPAECFMWHYTYDSLEQYFNKFNAYTSMAAEDMLDRGANPSKLKIVFNPFFGFVKQYFIKRGFMDGFHGLILAVLSSFYVFVKYLKHYFLYTGKK